MEKLTFNAATRFWRGSECLSVDDLIAAIIDGIHSRASSGCGRFHREFEFIENDPEQV